MESLCKTGGQKARPWLLRRACDGDYLNGYFAGKVATAAHLHEAITRADPDDELVDHTGRLLAIMADCGGMGMTLGHYPPAGVVLEAHAGHAHRLEPTLQRYFVVAQLADYLHHSAAEALALPAGQRERILGSYLSMLAREDWSEVARTGLAAGNHRMTWLARAVAPRLGLTALSHPD